MKMSNKSRVVNRRLCATSVVRPIEIMKPPNPDQPKNIIVKPKKKPNKNLPGTKLLIKLAQERQKQKEKQQLMNEESKIDDNIIDSVIDGIMKDLS
jgi:hypothetical protein